METFSALLALCAGNSPVPVNTPHKGQWRRALMFTLICTRMKGWVNNREAGDLRRNHVHYDVTVMITSICAISALRNDKKYKYILPFPKIDSTRQELREVERPLTPFFPTDTLRTNTIIITSKQHTDVVLAWWWRYYYVVCPLSFYSMIMYTPKTLTIEICVII